MDLVGMIVAPLDSKLEGGALGVVPDRPVMLQWNEASSEEIDGLRLDKQGHGVACQDVLLTHGPRPAFDVYLVSVENSELTITVMSLR